MDTKKSNHNVGSDFDEYLNYCSGSSDFDFRTYRSMGRPYNLTWGDEFVEYYAETLKLLGQLFQTRNEVLALVGTNRVAWDTALCSLIEPGDKVLIPSNGSYWHNFAVDIVKTYEGVPIVPKGNPRKPITPEVISNALSKEDDVKAVMMVHVETDGGIVNPYLEEIGKVIREKSDALYVVDAATSLVCDEVNVDKWGADMCFSGSHKGLASPVGLAFLTVGRKAWKAVHNRKKPIPGWYNSLLTWKEVDILKCAEGKIGFSFPLPILHAVRSRLDYIFKKGPKIVVAEHEIAARAVRNCILAMGLELFPDCMNCAALDTSAPYCRASCSSFCANAMTYVKFPPQVKSPEFESIMSRSYGIVAISMPYNRSGFILGTINAYQLKPRNLLACLLAVGLAMNKLGVKINFDGIKLADEILQEGNASE